MTPTDFLRFVMDPDRLALLGAAVHGPVDVDALAAHLETDRKKLWKALVVLRDAGLVDDRGQLDRAAFAVLGSQLPADEAAADAIVAGPWSADEAGILATFFKGARLTAIPSARSKRLVVLERLAQEFEPGVRYDERSVSFTLQLFHPDFAALRRYLVDEGFLTRADGVYWRSGGRFLDGIGAD